MIRTCSGAMPRIAADLVAVHIGRLRAGHDLDAVADPARKAGLGLDIGVLDEAGLESALGDAPPAGERRVGIAACDAAAISTLSGPAACTAAPRAQRRLEPSAAAATSQCDRARPSSRIAVDRRAVADQRAHRLAAEAHLAVGEAPAGP